MKARTMGKQMGIGMTTGCLLTFMVSMSGLVAQSAGTSDSRVADAVMRGDRAAMRSLVNQRAAVNGTQQDGSTALFWAVRSNDREATEFLISHGADVKAVNPYGVTALSLAAENGNAPIIEDLLKAGADANTGTSEGETVLMIAARSGSADAVKVLLDHGANVNAKEGWQEETALMYAAAQNHPEVVRLLLAHQAEVNVHSKVLEAPKRTPIPGVALQATHTTYPRGGLTALLFAARQGALQSARLLVEGKADLNQADPDGITPVMMAIMNAHYDVAALLINSGANVNAMDRTGRGPLYAAVDIHRLEWLFSRPTPRASGQLDSVDIVKLLLDKGANPNARLTRKILNFQHDSNGNSNLTAGSTPFMKAASTSDVALMKILLDHGADPNLTNQNKSTPLMVAAGLNWMDVTSLGTESESLEAIQLCLDHGADVNATNSLGETALHGAAERGADAIVKFLVAKGGNLSAKTTVGRTPLDEAFGQAAVLDESDVRRTERVSTEALIKELLSKNTAK